MARRPAPTARARALQRTRRHSALRTEARTQLRWNERAGRYQDARGRFVDEAAVRRDLDQALDASAREVRRLAGELQARRISLRAWEQAMRAEIKTVQVYSAAVAKGGLAQLAPADLGRAGALTREQYGYLRNFARQIRDGLPLDGRFALRAQMYAEAGRAAFHRTERAEKQRRGFTRERNRLGVADHCEGCVNETERGWVPIGQLVPIGERTCLTRCRCRIVYDKVTARWAA